MVVATLVHDGGARQELEAALAQAALVRETLHCADRREVREVLGAGRVDVFVVAKPDYDAHADLLDDFRFPLPSMLVLLSHADPDEAMLSGPPAPDGFLLRGALTAADVDSALRRMAAGEVPMPAPLARALMDRASTTRRPHGRRDIAVTARETEALLLLAEGLSNKQMARRLEITSHGVKRLVASLLLKLGAPNRTAAVVLAIHAGLIRTTLPDQGTADRRPVRVQLAGGRADVRLPVPAARFVSREAEQERAS
ncbi:helix-turn-helix transcriptional regulator [Streptomyces crystallinus]|uniref:HTH luxR-type domain-containing protein n=1 Tax=Streptomyces crystallinus TaxID=68191 RepID=A0ABP3QH61_9ACTN